jgi:hypothetical protein
LRLNFKVNYEEMKIVTPVRPGQPEIYLYETIDELRDHLGYPHVHGLYEPSKNRIHATPNSLAHEFAHFKDHATGAFRDPEQLEGEKKIQAFIRNEAVAILFAWLKQPRVENFLSFEKEFLDLAYFASKHVEPRIDINNIVFHEMQKYVDWLCQADHSWHPRLKKIFEHYWKETEAYSKSLRINFL